MIGEEKLIIMMQIMAILKTHTCVLVHAVDFENMMLIMLIEPMILCHFGLRDIEVEEGRDD